MTSSVVVLALFSRFVIFLLQVAFNWAVPDHKAEAFRSPWPPSANLGDQLVSWLFRGLTCWDGQYFLHIAEHGYTYEQTVAFFPLYPWLIRQTADGLVDPITCAYLARHSILILSGVLVNVAFFVVAAVALHRLTHQLFSKEQADEAVLLFCFNPASIFFSACYSESVFAAVSFLGFLLLEQNRPNLATVFFSLGGLVRSNGFLSAGFLLYSGFVCGLTPVRSVFRAAFCFLPFLLFQCYVWSLFCIPDYSMQFPAAIVNQATESGFKLAGRNASKWCSSVLPFSYGYVQSHYWDVGFLKYYRLKQLPNFLLAFPVVVTVLHSSAMFLKRCSDGRHVPYFLHAVSFLIITVLFANVQVTTRLVAAASPVLYWAAFYGSSRLQKKTLCVWADVAVSLWQNDVYSKRIVTYFLGYTILGTALHVNFLPWT